MYSHPFDHPRNYRTPDPATMRVSNAERAEITNALCRHFGDGRLDEAELEDRLARAAAAKTRADLAPLLADLPPLDAGPPAAARSRPRAPRSGLVTGLLLGLVAVAILAWSATGIAAHVLHPQVPWLVIAIVVLVLLRRGRGHRHRHPPGHWDRY